MVPLVSVILPTFNRAHFLKHAFDSLTAQTFTHFEVIIVDDGSSDNTKQVIDELAASFKQPVHYLVQENQGPGVARQNGINSANGEVLAFFDSDDEWLPDHLAEAIEILDQSPECDWIYFACRRIEKASQKILLESTFHSDSGPNKLFSIAQKVDVDLYKLHNQQAAILQLKDGIDSGLQNSVIRKRVFTKVSIPPFRIGEDRLFILMAIKNGFTLFFKDKVTVIYNVHDGNTSDTASGDDRFDRRITSMERLLRSYEDTTSYAKLNAAELTALNERLADDYFWKLGYSLYWQSGDKTSARECYKKALKLIHYRNFKMLKSYLLSFLK